MKILQIHLNKYSMFQVLTKKHKYKSQTLTRRRGGWLGWLVAPTGYELQHLGSHLHHLILHVRLHLCHILSQPNVLFSETLCLRLLLASRGRRWRAQPIIGPIRRRCSPRCQCDDPPMPLWPKHRLNPIKKRHMLVGGGCLLQLSLQTLGQPMLVVKI